jgi:hypothetical protein
MFDSNLVQNDFIIYRTGGSMFSLSFFIKYDATSAKSYK